MFAVERVTGIDPHFQLGNPIWSRAPCSGDHVGRAGQWPVL